MFPYFGAVEKCKDLFRILPNFILHTNKHPDAHIEIGPISFKKEK